MLELKLKVNSVFHIMEQFFPFGMFPSLTDNKDKLWKEGANTCHSPAEQRILRSGDAVYCHCHDDPLPKGPIPQFTVENLVRLGHQSKVTQSVVAKLSFKHGSDARVLPVTREAISPFWRCLWLRCQ